MSEMISPKRSSLTHATRSWLGLLVAVGCMAGLAANSFGQNNALVLDWPLGKDIGSGFYYYFTPGDGGFKSAQNYRNGVTISFGGPPSHYCTLFFAAPGGVPLTQGTYEGAVAFAQPDKDDLPQMSMSGDVGFAWVSTFVVKEVVYGAANSIISFHATFSQQPSGSDPPAVGEVLFNSTAPLPPDESKLRPPEEILYVAAGGEVDRFRPNGSRTAGQTFSLLPSLAFDRRGSYYEGGWRTDFDNQRGGYRTFGTVLKFGTAPQVPGGYVPGFEHTKVLSLACDHDGNLFVGEGQSETPSRITKTTPAGDRTVFTELAFSPQALAFDSADNLYVGDDYFAGQIVKFTPSGDRTYFFLDGGKTTGLAFDADDNLFVSNSVLGTVKKISQAGAVTVVVSGLKDPQGVTVDRSGHVFVHNSVAYTSSFPSYFHSILKCTQDGNCEPFAGVSSGGFDLKFAPHPVVVPENIATRAYVGSGQNVLIAGFIVAGVGSKQVIVRGIGPSLSQFGITNALPDPRLELHDSAGKIIATNDNWKDSQFLDLSWSGLAPTDNRESAMITTLNPGAYTVVLQGVNEGTGVGLVEVYGLDPRTIARLGNLSTRSVVGTSENVLIAGFVLGAGEVESPVVVRALGPSLKALDVDGALADPTLELHDKNGVLIASNDDWRQQQENELSQTGLAPANDRESAILTHLSAGNYTVVARGKGDTTGIGVVEVYHLE